MWQAEASINERMDGANFLSNRYYVCKYNLFVFLIINITYCS